MGKNIKTMPLGKIAGPLTSGYRDIFHGGPENVDYYQKTVQDTLEVITHFLQTRQTPLGDTSVHSNKNKIGLIDINSKETISVKECLTELCDIYINDATAFHHSSYVAHLNCPILIPTLAAEMIISSINSSMDTWDQSIGATAIELRLIEWMGKKLQYPEGFDGVFTSGGTQSNLMGLLLARDSYIKKNYNVIPDQHGLPAEAKKFKIFCSEMSHFSLSKGASILGLGKDAIISVPVDKDYRMDISKLKDLLYKEQENGNLPITLIGTAGTTDFGSVDPLHEISRIAQENGMWFHVDAAYGGGLLLSKKHCNKLSGIEKADSCTIDLHKTFFQPISASMFLMRDHSNVSFIQYHADYLNPKEQEACGVPNLVKKSLQTTRRFDALKFWFTLRTVGEEKLGSYIDEIIYLAKGTHYLLDEHQDFEVLNTPEISALVFRYAPEGLSKNKLTELNQKIKQAVFDSGKAMVAGTKVNNEFYLKFTLLNPMTTLVEMRNVIHLIQKIGEEQSKNLI
ncbi:aspartate aminotransferase family protein [Chryseobacterium rhizoplanae]|uniref:pyridoxal phosphate-dependent decarboxylase family protein n=1 Tax=Chryseobacterium rhizoplanae TaxID=1609531 RepID=UPI001CE30A4D|nr:aspartate aminotransferase family protein [Chryseobacterium rhizoplanae]UCA61721.1 aspartate aminotransferase family protein [Chryseobacterium rhizoplanae]